MIGTFSRGIAKRRLLPLALGDDLIVCTSRTPVNRLAGIIGWGVKDNTKKARKYARRHALPYVTLEDGFIRSVGLGVQKAEPFGFIFDRQGIYYDAQRPSDIETLIKRTDSTAEHQAKSLMNRLVHIQASKYNHAWHAPTLPSDDRPNILLIDQTHGDLSVKYGLADETSFRRMVDIATQRNPQARFFAKIHPDVIAGKKNGYLKGQLPSDVTIITDDCNPMGLLKQVDHVFTVTSQMGFEALLAGKPVTCIGMPFYAGWGLTEDLLTCPRRGVKRTLAQVFQAAYLRYVRYVDPITEQTCGLERILDLIENHKRVFRLNNGDVWCYGFHWWKRGIIRQFLGAGNVNVTFHNKFPVKSTDRSALPSRLVVWGARHNRQIDSFVKRHSNSMALERVEDGFIRSVGLGSDLTKPASLIVDRRGIYFDPRQPSDLEWLLNTIDLDDIDINRARRLRHRIIDSGISKYNTGRSGWQPTSRGSKRVILVPGQVEDDASIQTGGIDIKTNHHLLKVVRQANPDAHIIFKPHPDVVAGNRVGKVPDAVAIRLCDDIVIDCDIKDCLDQADEVHTVTSLTGFEALLRDKIVHTYGLPFYAGWGLTVDRHTVDRRRRRRSIDELLYCALILYPRYYHWGARLFVSAEDAVETLLRLKSGSDASINIPAWRRVAHKALNLYENCSLLFKR